MQGAARRPDSLPVVMRPGVLERAGRMAAGPLYTAALRTVAAVRPRSADPRRGAAPSPQRGARWLAADRSLGGSPRLTRRRGPVGNDACGTATLASSHRSLQLVFQAASHVCKGSLRPELMVVYRSATGARWGPTRRLASPLAPAPLPFPLSCRQPKEPPSSRAQLIAIFCEKVQPPQRR